MLERAIGGVRANPVFKRLTELFPEVERVVPRPSNEVPPEQYLSTLADVDKRKVEDFLGYARTLSAALGNIRIGVNAVGSTVRPPDQNFRPIGDIDLRILNSAPHDSPERTSAVAAIRDGLRGYLVQQGTDFREEDCTITQARKSEYIDFYNDDPSFKTLPNDGLPLHISISGVDNPDLDAYMKLEGTEGFYYSPLYSEPSPV